MKNKTKKKNKSLMYNVEYTVQFPTMEECVKHSDFVRACRSGKFVDVEMENQFLYGRDLGKTFKVTCDEDGYIHLKDGGKYDKSLGLYVKVLKKQKFPELTVRTLNYTLLIIDNKLQVDCQKVSKKDALTIAKFIQDNIK